MRLVDNWRDAWRWISVQALSALVALPIVWATLPDDAKAFVPEGWAKYIMLAIALGGLVGRMIDQKGKTL